MQRVRARQREEYGGINWGAAFFGWLVAVGVAVLLTGLLAAAGAAIGLTESSAASEAQSTSPETLSLAGAIALIAVLAIAYYCGGYVAGRMSRFDGARQGIGTWVIGLLITIGAAILAVIAGSSTTSSNAPTCRACRSAKRPGRPAARSPRSRSSSAPCCSRRWAASRERATTEGRPRRIRRLSARSARRARLLSASSG